MVKVQTLIQQIEAFAPKDLAEKGDPVGLQIGDPQQEIHKVMTTLDVRPETVQEAIEQKVDFIWAHHEAMFFPARNLDLSNPQNKMYADLLRHDIVVYASHTNLDAAAGGMNDWLGSIFGLQDLQPLLPNPDGQSGLGRIGILKEDLTVSQLAQKVKQACQVAEVRVITNDLDRRLHTVALLAGDGGRYWFKAQELGADAYITADLYYHVGHDILANDFVVIDPDHHMEALAKEPMATLIREWQPDLGVYASQVNTDPYRYI